MYINIVFIWWFELKGDLYLYVFGVFDIIYNGLIGMWIDYVNVFCCLRGD